MALSSKQVGPYYGISKDETIEFEGKGAYRILLYGAFKVMGLVSTGHNGVAIIDVEADEVVCDRINSQPEGSYSPSDEQLGKFDLITKMGWKEFRFFLTNHKNFRWSPDERHG